MSNNPDRSEARQSNLIRDEPISVESCLCDLQAWIEHALNGEIKYRATTTSYGPTHEGYSYVEIPEWSMRQKLANIIDARNMSNNLEQAVIYAAIAANADLQSHWLRKDSVEVRELAAAVNALITERGANNHE